MAITWVAELPTEIAIGDVAATAPLASGPSAPYTPAPRPGLGPGSAETLRRCPREGRGCHSSGGGSTCGLQA